jgi:hypothetical protein
VPQMLVRSPLLGVRVLRKMLMKIVYSGIRRCVVHSCSRSWAYRVVLTHYRYGPLSDDLMPMKVIVGQSKYSGELCEL